VTEISDLHAWMLKRFGFGDWDDRQSEVPYWKWRNTEIAKLTAWMKKWRLRTQDMYLFAEYAAGHGIPVEHWSQLRRYAIPAIREQQQRDLVKARAELDHRIELAIEMEVNAERRDAEWMSRLSRSSGDGREVVYAQWRKYRLPELEAALRAAGLPLGRRPGARPGMRPSATGKRRGATFTRR
jgi:hypothetical protein